MVKAADGVAGFKSGFVTILGAPNVGKSTFLNRVLGQKISITSKKPQTTRNRILGVVHRPAAQLVFLDTPGIHQAKNPLNVRIVEIALGALGECDVVLLMVDTDNPDAEAEKILVKALTKQNKPAILALNKIDLVKKEQLLTLIEAWTKRFDFKAVVPISAKSGEQVDTLLETMEKVLPPGPPYFPQESLTDQPERFIVAEMIREKVFRLTGQEIPYASAVTIDTFDESGSKPLIKISATIHLERASQKGILIGKGGQKLKQIGIAARSEIENLLATKIYLKLFVRVQKNWRKDTKALRKFGY